ncbi:hypothetical protein [Prevotella pectinovora]|uniref:hypothetical protein n=1 Tax=Prevotella pectinovora TaxID=1602169 RepID=UPI0012E0BE9D|nr:hypothetical protein [Prevotella pectinovora]
MNYPDNDNPIADFCGCLMSAVDMMASGDNPPTGWSPIQDNSFSRCALICLSFCIEHGLCYLCLMKKQWAVVHVAHIG